MIGKSIKLKGARALLSFHDITIYNFQNVDRFLKKLEGEGVLFCALLIIPYIPDTCTQQESDAFRTWLNKQYNSGKEIFLHGFRHISDPSLNRSLLGKFKNVINSQEAEFAGLDALDTFETLEKGLASFAKIFDQPPHGFVAPTWFDSPTLKGAVFEKGITCYEGRFSLYSISGASTLTLPISWFQNGAVLFTFWSIIFKLFSLLPIQLPIKIAIHPIDTEVPQKEIALLAVCRVIAKKRQFTTYKSLFLT